MNIRKQDCPIRVGLYARVSTHEQVADGYSIEDQKKTCVEYLDRLYGSNNYSVRMFIDEGISGRKGFARPGSKAKDIRPALTDLVAAIAGHEIDSVIAYRMDRIHRKARVWHEFLNDFILPSNVSIIFVREQIDTTTATGRFAASILASAAELFADLGAENVKAAMRRRKEDGYPTGRAGYGWSRKPKEPAHG